MVRGEDFSQELATHDLQSAMHVTAQLKRLKCHTRKQKNGLQVQFYRPEIEEQEDNGG